MSSAGTANWEGCLVAVTGASGGFGGFLVGALTRLGANVRALDLIRKDHTGAFAEAERRGAFEFVHLDICDESPKLTKALQGVQVVFHTVAHMGSPASSHPFFEDPHSVELAQRITVGGTARILDAAVENGVAAFVHTSSANILFYGEAVCGATEDTPYPAPELYLDTYSRVKAEAERLVLQSNGRGGLRTVSIRPQGIWGPSEECITMAKMLLYHAVAGGIWSRLSCRRVHNSSPLMDWAHVKNLCLAEILAAERLCAHDDVVSGECYHITDSHPWAIGEGEIPMVKAAHLNVCHLVTIPGQLLALLGLCTEAIVWPLRRLTGSNMFTSFSTYPEVLKATTTNYFNIEKARKDLNFDPIKHEVLMAEMQDWVQDWADKRFHVPEVHLALKLSIVPGMALTAYLALADIHRFHSLPWTWAHTLFSWIPNVVDMSLEQFQRKIMFTCIFVPAIGIHIMDGFLAAALARNRDHLLWRVYGFRGFVFGFAQLHHLTSPWLARIVGVYSVSAFAAAALFAARLP